MTDTKHPQDPEENLEEEDLSFEEDEETKLQEGQSFVLKLKKVKAELQKCSEEKKEYLEGWQRAKADYINYKKESEANRTEIADFAKASILSDLFPVLDSFEMAFANRESWEQAPENWRKGIEYIHTQLISVLRNNGVSILEPKGERFNPSEHESVGSIDTTESGEDNMVLEVVKKGYKLNQKILRPASVKVGHFNKEN